MKFFVIFCLVFIGSTFASSIAKKMKEEEKSPKFVFVETNGGGTYNRGETAYVSVKVDDGGAVDENDDWKFCTWTRLKDNSKCKFSYVCSGAFCDIGLGDFKVIKSCDSNLDFDINFFGEDPNASNHVCGIEIRNLDQMDSSGWKVQVEECRVTGCGTETGNGYVIETTININVI
eukprot:TRINITY_DN39621_c0_g1_i1.p1 TRINITY_DN39621_c0_g1~~TRINITY_DN39621_c0_g1_i1.p1  ORF type:complete len:175 (+),score=36.57 TRINITY_DN39621_c0_g1_i1:33-557(+)